MKPHTQSDKLFKTIRDIVASAREQAFRQSNSILLQMYWDIGRLIVEDEQQGKSKAQYGKAVLKNLSDKLTLEFGKGFDERNLNNMRAFYLSFPIWYAVRTELSWTHYRILSRIENEQIRNNYLVLAADSGWDTRTLERNIKTQFLGRMIEKPVSGNISPSQFVKDPYIFEFLGLPNPSESTETQLEHALINNLQKFIMELGKGFAFVARQQHIVTDTSDFYIDLVF